MRPGGMLMRGIRCWQAFKDAFAPPLESSQDALLQEGSCCKKSATPADLGSADRRCGSADPCGADPSGADPRGVDLRGGQQDAAELGRACTRVAPHPQAPDPTRPSSDIEDIACTDCHDTQTRQPCGRKCDVAARAAVAARKASAAPPAIASRARAPRPLHYADPATSLEYHRPTDLASLVSLIEALWVQWDPTQSWI